MACCLSAGVPCPFMEEGGMDCRLCPYSNGEADE